MATNWKIVDGNLPYEDNFVSPIPNTDMSDTNAPDFFFRIIDGDLPFRRTFHSIPSINGCSILYWLLDPNNEDPSKSTIPFRFMFPENKSIDGVPETIWFKRNEDPSPWKKTFPEIINLNDVPLGMWVIKEGIDPVPWRRTFPKMYKIVKELPKKFKEINIKTKGNIDYCIIDNEYLTYNVKVRKGVR